MAAVACIALTGIGCRLAGTWVTIDVEPADATFPIAEITFDQNGHCTADMATNGDRRTLVGTYRWRGTKLVIEPDDGATQVYRARRLMNGKLRLKLTEDRKIGAILERRE